MLYKLGTVMIAPREEVLCGKVRKIVIFYKKKKRTYILHYRHHSLDLYFQ